MKSYSLKTLVLSLGLTFGYGSAVLADDTDIYLGEQVNVIRPNLLFVLDTSDSMNAKVSGTEVSRLQSMREAMHDIVLGLDNINVGLMRFNGRRTGDNQTPTGGAVVFPVNNLDDPISAVPSETSTVRTISVAIATSEDDATQVFDLLASPQQTTLSSVTLETPVRNSVEVTKIFQIGAGSDDSTENPGDGFSNSLGGQIKIQDEKNSGQERRLGLRFTNISVPADANILSAKISFTANNIDNKAQSILIRGEDATNPGTFTNDVGHLQTRFGNATPEVVQWAPETVFPEDVYTTPNLSSIVSQLTSAANSWVSGNSLVFLLEDEEENQPKTAKRRAYSFNTDSNKAPRLEITYSESATAVHQLIGLRFQNVGIPQGATIIDAHLELVSDGPSAREIAELADPELDSSDGIQTGASIYYRVTDDAPPFSGGEGGLFDGSGGYSQAYEGSIGPVGEEFNLVEVEPDGGEDPLSESIAELVDRPGWCGGNAMTFIVTNEDFRLKLPIPNPRVYPAPLEKIFKSFDSESSPEDPIAPMPRLRVTFDTAGITGSDTGCNRQEFSYRPAESQDDATETLADNVTNVTKHMRTGNTKTYTNIDSSTAVSGIRFPGLEINQGADVLEAYLELTVFAEGSGNTDLTITGEDTGNALQFESTLSDISDTSLRPRTAASGLISISEDSNAGETIRSSDISSIINEITGRGDWAGGQAINLFVSGGSNERRFFTFNDDQVFSARLTILVAGGTEATVRQRVLQLIDQQLETLNRTPTVETLYEAALYWRGDDVYYGTHRGQGGFPNGVDNPNDNSDFAHNDQGNGKDNNNIAGDKLDRRDPDQGMNFGRVSHPDSYTGGTLVQPNGCSSDDLDHPDCFSEVINGTGADAPTYISPFAIAECQSNYMIFLSDGAPTANNEAPGLIAGLVPDLGSSDDCVANSKNNSGKCAIDLLEFLAEEDQSVLDGDQLVKTYTIGFNTWEGEFEEDGEGNQLLDGDGNPIKVLSNTELFMQELALAGGGTFQSADTAAELTETFKAIVQDIFSDVSSFAAPSLTVNAFNKLFHRNEVYFSLFEPNRNVRWDGNIKKYKICDGSDSTCVLGEIIDADDLPAIDASGVIDTSARSIWTPSGESDGPKIIKGGVGIHFPDPSLRKIYSYPHATAPDPANPVDLGESDYLLTTSDTSKGLYDELLGFADGDTSTDLDDLIRWVLGFDTEDEDNDGSVVDSRWLVNDPLHGSPLALTYGCDDGVPGVPCPDTGDNAIVKILVAGNDGSIRMFNGSNQDEVEGAPAGGVEEWAFFPQQLLINQATLKHNGEGEHIYGVDSTPTIIQFDENADGIIDPATGEYVRAYFTMRRGGNSIFALDVTPDQDGGLTDQSTGGITPKYLWRIDGQSSLAPDFTNMGQTWSQPKPAFVRVPASGNGNSELKAVLIFGGGYDPAQDDGFGVSNIGNSIFIIDADTGERVWWASNEIVTDGNGEHPNLELDAMDFPIPSDIALLDTTGDGATNRLYVGDLGGQVWRIDLDDQLGGPSNGNAENIDNTSGARLAVLANHDGDPTGLEDNRKFFYAPDVIQVADTVFAGQDYDLVSLVSGDRANPLEEDVLNRAYGLRDFLISEPLTETGVYPLTDAVGDDDIYDATADLIQVGDEDEQAAAKAALIASSGWLIDLVDDGVKNGEKGLSSPIVLAGKLFFTTFVPGDHDPCSATLGVGRLYGLDAITAGALFEDWLEGGNDGELEKGDRVYALGGGIPSSAVPIFQKKGVTLLIGTGGGAESVDPDIELPRIRTYWYQEQ